MVSAVISLAHSLGLKAIAEGVEQPHHLAELKTLGCEYAQGYLYSKAKSADNWDSYVISKGIFEFSSEKI